MGTTDRKAEGGKPRQLGKYELIARIAAGGMAEVFLARQLGMMNFQKVVVVKLIHPHLSTEAQFVEMFLDEARISALIKHHNVVDIYDLGLEDDVYFIAMEYIEGQALSRVLGRAAQGRRLDVFTTTKLIADAATGLDAAHNLTSITGDHLELVHRDVSPGNILISYAGAVKLVDFGVSQSLSQLKTSSENRQLKGKIGYASPEQLEELPLDHRSDLFSLGVVLWESLTLRRLFRAESPAATVRKILAGNPPAPSRLRPEVPAALDAITLRALALKPEDRYQTATEMRDDLLAVLREASYHGDERVLAEYMTSVFAKERAAQEDLLKRVVTAEEEIEVDIDLDAEISDIRDPELRAAGAPVPRPESAHEEELEAELVLDDDEGDEPSKAPSVTTTAEVPAPVGARTVAVTAPVPARDAAVTAPAPSGQTEAATTSVGPTAQIAPVSLDEVVSLKKKRPMLAIFLVGAGLLAVIVLGIAIVGGGSDDEAKKRQPPPAPEPEQVVAPAPTPDAAVPPEMIGLPPPLEVQAVGHEVALQSARMLYLEGWALHEAGKGDKARDKYRAALEKIPEFAPALRGLGLSYASENREKKATQYLGEYLRVAPSATDVETMRAKLRELASSRGEK